MGPRLVAVLIEIVDDMVARVDVAVAEQRLRRGARAEPLEGTLAQLLGQRDERGKQGVGSFGDVGQGHAQAARYLRVVDLVDILGRWRVWAAIAQVGQRIAKPFAPHADVEQDQGGRPALGLFFGLARFGDELALHLSLGIERLAKISHSKSLSGRAPWPAREPIGPPPRPRLRGGALARFAPDRGGLERVPAAPPLTRGARRPPRGQRAPPGSRVRPVACVSYRDSIESTLRHSDRPS